MKITVHEFFDRCASTPETVTVYINGIEKVKRLNDVELIEEFIQQYGNENIDDFEIYRSMNGYSVNIDIS